MAAVLICAGGVVVAQTPADSPAAEAPAPPSPDVAPLLAEARARMTENNHEAALKNLDAAIAAAPQNQEARQLRGDLYFKLGELDKAMADYAELRTDRAAALTPRVAGPTQAPADWTDVSELFRRAADAARERGFDDAISIYNAVLSMNVPHQLASVAAQNRGNMFAAKKERERALEDYEQAIRLNPANAGAYVNRGIMLAEMGEHEAAVRDFDEAIRFDAKLAEAFYNRAASLANLEKPEAAARNFAEAIRLNPEFAPAHVGLGFLLAGKKEFANARILFERGVELDPGHTGAWMGLASLDQRSKRFAAALTKLEKAIARHPDAAAARNFAAWLYATAPVASARNGKKAVQHALKACELSNWNVFAYVDTLAAGYAEQGDFRRATDFQWYALSLMEADDANRPEAEARLRLFQQRRKYRETKPPEEKAPGEERKDAKPEKGPTPPLLQSPGGPVGSSSPRLRPSEDRAGSARALLRSCA